MRRAARRRRGAPARPAAVPLALLLLLADPRQSARAEDFLAYKYVDYAEAGGRIGVRTQVLDASQGIDADTQLGLVLTNDAIAGASPTGLPAPAGSGQVPLAHLSDHRKEWEADLARQVQSVNIDLGVSESREHDYVSRGWSLNTLSDFNDRNTTLIAGAGGHDDDAETFFTAARPYAPRHAFSAVLGGKQLLDPLTFVTVSATWGRETGYLDDQYKLVQKTLELAPGSFFPTPFAENLPDTHDFVALLASVNRSFPGARAALEASLRWYRDTYGVSAGTLEAGWLQKLGGRLTLEPSLRLHEQGAASFYHYDLDATDIMPTQVPDPAGPNYSSDYRLSSLWTATYGLKLACKLTDRLQADLAYDRYAMHGRDGVTPGSAYPSANIVSAGARFSW
jgi:hypothetical protein